MARIHAVMLLVVAVAMSCAVKGTFGGSLDHIVGGRNGWSLPPNTTLYQQWTQNKTFVVGDKLVFMYTSALQNVMEVSKEDFDACTDKKIINWYYTGPTVLELKTPGPHYYYCGVGTHCESGQKLFINVSATPVYDPARDGFAPPPGSLAAAKSSASSIGRYAGALAGLIPSLLISLLM